jgi:protoheme IX farnesyltransferase
VRQNGDVYIVKRITRQMKKYAPLFKGLQTGLLVFTGLAGYMSARCPVFNLPTLAGLFFALAASISGSTILNMWWDRDIDALMHRTCNRPLASGRIPPRQALLVGLLLSFLGVTGAFLLDPLTGLIIFSGLFFDVVIYTILLKRRSCWSIVFGGISGGMPILAGRALAAGRLDWIGVLLSLGILFWIPTHILSFSIRNASDYQRAGVPTFVSTYGIHTTRLTIAITSILAAIALVGAAIGIGVSWGYLRLLAVLSIGLLIYSIVESVKPTERGVFGLYKFASIYMLSSMFVLFFRGV